MVLTEENFLLFAIKNYNNPSCKNMKEFNEDLHRLKYIVRLLNRYKKKKILREKNISLFTHN